MKLKMLCAMSGGPNLVAGDIIDQPETVAKAWIEAGLATAADESEAKPKPADPEPAPEPEPRPDAEVVMPSLPSEGDDVEMPSRPADEPPEVQMPSVPAPEPEVIEEATVSAPQNAALKRGRKVK